MAGRRMARVAHAHLGVSVFSLSSFLPWLGNAKSTLSSQGDVFGVRGT